MASFDRLVELLPSLWRPEPEAPRGELLVALLRAAGARFDAAAVEAGDVMQSHWIRTADSALVSPFVARLRAEAGEGQLLPGDPAIDQHPHLDDLPRLAALLGLAPWQEPLEARERVEDFRRRIRRIVLLYREGLGTRAALWRMTRASLPVADRAVPLPLGERGFTVEEAAPDEPRVLEAPARGAPDGLVGPLMRWRVESGALLPTAPEILVTGVQPAAGAIDATESPIVERFDPTTGTGVGIGYEGTLAPGDTLAILPTVTSWLGTDSALLASRSGAQGDPTAAGPWIPAEGAPAGAVVALTAAADGALWVAVNAGGQGGLWRLGADGWAEAVPDLPELLALAPDGDGLLIGHANGLARVALLAAALDPVPDPGAAAGPAVRALARDDAGRWWAATATGAAQLGQAGLEPVGPGARGETEPELDAVHADAYGQVYLGGREGLFLHDPALDRWHVYRGGTADETVPDWAPWHPADPLPPEDEGFLPRVTALHRGSDGTLWIGTAAGIAAYRARARRGTYATLLTAFPELGTMPVHAIAEDARQRLWFATGRGLLVWDGTDWRQLVGSALTRLARADDDPLAFTHWRFDRDSEQWQAQERGARAGFTARTPEPLTAAEAAVRAIAWTDGAEARLGTLADGGFIDGGPAPGPLSLRIKPDATRIVTGGVPAIPRLPPGGSDWRYLAREEAAPSEPRAFPAWTREGRLLPPPDGAAAPLEGRFLTPAEALLLDQVFPFNPAARVTLRWCPRAALSITVRLERRRPDEALAPAVLDRLRDGLKRVRPAGARVRVALGEEIVMGGVDG
jgi:hypothetical protein